MDPNVTLAELRRDVDELATLELSPEDDAAVQAVINRWRALDGWLTRGGFKPTDWTTTRVPTTVDEIQRELDAHPSWRGEARPDPDGGAWSDPAVRDAVARTVEATPDDLEEHYDEDEVS